MGESIILATSRFAVVRSTVPHLMSRYLAFNAASVITRAVDKAFTRVGNIYAIRDHPYPPGSGRCDIEMTPFMPKALLNSWAFDDPVLPTIMQTYVEPLSDIHMRTCESNTQLIAREVYRDMISLARRIEKLTLPALDHGNVPEASVGIEVFFGKHDKDTQWTILALEYRGGFEYIPAKWVR